MADPSRGTPFRLAEAIAALSLTTDLGMGQPMGHGLRTCLLAVRLGETLGMDIRELGETYYLALLRLISRTADAHISAAVLGDDVAARGFLTGVDWWDAADDASIGPHATMRRDPGAGRSASRVIGGSKVLETDQGAG